MRLLPLLTLLLALSGCGGGSEDNNVKAPSTGGLPKEQAQEVPRG